MVFHGIYRLEKAMMQIPTGLELPVAGTIVLSLSA
jgi:hypothetical protein